ncbi:sulfotransferase [Virgibacillus necropolis]|uniref:sulfotransferase family protein n=1 Tax=Virgibacillus necropolis TaxID=163877 RepID=UPI00384C6B86
MGNSERKNDLMRVLKNKKTLIAVGSIASAAGSFKIAKRKKETEPKPNSKAVVVLGSGRSGTSVLARAINIAGVDLGSGFIKTNQTNPKGFFENKKIVNTHKKIGEILKKRPFPKGFPYFDDVRPYRNELKDYIQEEFFNKKVWGWKDPRNNEFLEMWKGILKEINVEGNYLIIIRNPVDVIASYKRAYDRDETWAKRQWQLRTLLALRETKKEKRIIVEYDELFNNSLESMRRVSNTLDFEWPQEETKIKNELDEFIDPSLQTSNSGTDIEEFKNRQDVEDDIKELFLLCLEGARSQKYLESKSFQQRVEKLYQAYLRKHGKLHVMPPKNNNQ